MINLLISTIIFLGLLKIALDIWRNKLLMDNNAALAAMQQAVLDATAAMKDLAAKAAAGEDISTPLSSLATNLEAAVTASGEPTGVTG